ncbi:MAG: NAD(P)/FAD-dependent oxidoreductase [Candidatus Hadarchaeia archaeon]
MSRKRDVLIIGGGPAGLTAAIYTSRAEFDTLVLDKPDDMLEKVDSIENYFGFPEGISGGELLEKGRSQAIKFGTDVLGEEALIVKMEEEAYLVETADEEFLGKGLILAPGIKHQKPPLEGLEDFEGKGVSYCVTCDAPFYKEKRVGLLGSKDYAAKEITELAEFTDDIVMFTNGENLEIREDLKDQIDELDISIVKEEVEGVLGEDSFSGLALSDEEIELDGLFVAVGTSGSVDFARSLGIPVEGDRIVVDEDLSAGLPRLYAAGDCTGGARQLSVAVGEGTKAALNLIGDLRGEEYTDWKKGL